LNKKIDHFTKLVEEAKSSGADRIAEIQAAHNSALAQMKEIKQHLSDGGKLNEKELEQKLASMKASSEDIGNIRTQVTSKMSKQSHTVRMIIS
jgi:outer membrane protein assembly factor BamA